jgi:hypothetical protein
MRSSKQYYATDALMPVRVAKTLQPGDELWFKRAWHQLSMRQCLVEVPDGSFVCDVHTQRA